MSIDIKVPVLPESVSNATVATWHKKPGDSVSRDELLVDIETDKVVLEVVAPQDGVLENILKETGATVIAKETIGLFKAEANSVKIAQPSVQSSPVKELKTLEAKAESAKSQPVKSEPAKAPEPKAQAPKAPPKLEVASEESQAALVAPPALRRRLMASASEERTVRRIPMSRLRSRMAERLLDAQKTAAILTTFNEVNMKPIMDLRAQHKDRFEKVHGVKLGFMSFFTMAVVAALKKFPTMNAFIEGGDIVYHDYYDVAIAVSTPRGLVVPVVRNAEKLSMAEIEENIVELSEKARDGKLTLEEITGGTFTISNGGVFGSLLSTPILNAPQTGILGMHKIEERPIVEKGQIVIKPMMYIALSYDHRLIDGRESVQFLLTIKELLEDPIRGLLNI